MTQLRLVASRILKNVSPSQKLASVKSRILRVGSSNSLPSVAVKSAKLHALNASAALVIEKLVDDLLDELAIGQL